ncbi:hypothetical protein RFI_01195, partial [Reticulomyxa filosa]
MSAYTSKVFGKNFKEITNRQGRKNLGKSTLEILEKGYYTSKQGEKVDIRLPLEKSIKETTLIGEENFVYQHALKKDKWNPKEMLVDVTHETTLEAAYRLKVTQNIRNVTLLSGGFLGGSQAQVLIKKENNNNKKKIIIIKLFFLKKKEESLARSGGLYHTLTKYQNDFYNHHKKIKSLVYSHKIIFSPNVPFIRNDNGDLLDAFYSCNVITCAAVNAGYVKKNYTDIKLANEYIFTTMKERIRRILE